MAVCCLDWVHGRGRQRHRRSNQVMMAQEAQQMLSAGCCIGGDDMGVIVALR
jgi:hypothetical protein